MRKQNGTGTLSSLRDAISRLHHDERGAEGLEKLLIIAAIVIPLLGLLIFFRGEITSWVTEKWDAVEDDARNYDPQG